MPHTQGTAVITGASAGIGATFARRLAREGYDLLLIARRRDRLEALAAEISAATGRHVEILEADLATESGLHAAAERLGTVPNLVLLINNAGFGLLGRFFEASVEDHERMHRLHIMAPLRLTHAALRRMIPISQGAIINVASVAGFTASPGSVSYSATKHWMNNFTEGLWLDLKTRGSGVRVQALCPGFTYSEFHDVMPMDRGNIHPSLWCKAEDVVDASLRGLQRDKLFVIPGWRYRLLVGLLGLVPASLRHSGAVWYARTMRRLGS